MRSATLRLRARDRRSRAFPSDVLATTRRLLRHRGLLRTLTGRELKARYRGSALGYLWSLVNPLLLLAVYTFVFSVVFQPRDPNVHPYGLFLATGVFPWMWVQTAWMEGSGSLIANAALIRKASFPAELLPIVPVLANLVHFALAVPVLVLAFGVATLLGHETGGWTVLLVPLIVGAQLPMVGGLALGFAALNAHFKDVRDILANLLTLGFFLAPILYTLRSLEGFKPIQWVVRANPVTPFIRGYQEAAFYGRFPGPALWIEMLLVSFVAWWIGCWLFERLSDTLVEAV